MKAYLVSDKNYDSECFKIIFAETRGKAIAYACGSDGLDDYTFTEIRAIRIPELDSYYRGLLEMDWYNDNDRLGMVRYANMYCGYDYEPTDDCESCSARQYCERYERIQQGD